MRERFASMLRRIADWLDPSAGQRVIDSLSTRPDAPHGELARELVAESPESKALAAKIARYDVTPTQADRMAGRESVVPTNRFALRAGRLKTLR